MSGVICDLNTCEYKLLKSPKELTSLTIHDVHENIVLAEGSSPKRQPVILVSKIVEDEERRRLDDRVGFRYVCNVSGQDRL
jgi:hypothetical protein